MDIYKIDQVSEVPFANILLLISRSLTAGPKKIGFVLAEQTMKIIALCKKCKIFFYAMLINGRVFVIVVKTSLTKTPSKHGDVLLLPLCCVILREIVFFLPGHCLTLNWIEDTLSNPPKGGDSSVMFEIPKETTRNKPFFYIYICYSHSQPRHWGSERLTVESDCRAPTMLGVQTRWHMCVAIVITPTFLCIDDKISPWSGYKEGVDRSAKTKRLNENQWRNGTRACGENITVREIDSSVVREGNGSVEWFNSVTCRVDWGNFFFVAWVRKVKGSSVL